MNKTTGLANVHQGIAGLNPYVPGKPIDELTRELGIADIIKLASNENPRGPGPIVMQALDSVRGDLSRYPDGSGYLLKESLASRLEVDTSQITLGNGSNDVLDLVTRVSVEPGYEAIISEHSFVVYRLATTCAGGTLVTVPAKDYGTDLEGMLGAITEKTRIIFIANPNNPTGTWVAQTELANFLRQVPNNVWVVLDEAYFEYIDEPDYPNGIELMADHPNLIVTRTFSKIHGLASVRLGYSISSPEMADLVNRARQPFNCSSFALAAGVAAIADTDFVATSLALNQEGLTQLTQGVAALGCDYIPSVGNFVSIDCGGPGPETFDALLHKGVITRPVAEYGLPRHLRVSVGLEAENERFLDAFKAVLNEREG
ncbi:MAG: histidinol-phosphate transaminase [Pseudomonadales bacterium]|nr:histidinol-phosphate transaminase [Pseudomonadales bacterium]